MKPWNKKQIKQHEIAGEKLTLIKSEFAQFLAQQNHRAKTAVSETDCIKFIKQAYKKHGLVNDAPKESCIVAFGKNTNQVHYFASTSKPYHLSSNTLVLLDVWARLDEKGAPYADATFVFYIKSKSKGQNSKLKVKDQKFEEYQKVWKVLSSARDSAIEYIKKEVKKGKIPRGLDIDRVSHDIIGEAGFGRGIKHTIGHSLGTDGPHGTFPGINWREYAPLLRNVGYTIEPGIYLEDFGMRSEVDFYINDNNQVIITTPLQGEIEIL